MLPVSTYAPIFTNDGINTTLGAINAECLTTQPGTALKPAVLNSSLPHPENFEGTLSHQLAGPLLTL